MIRLEVLRLQGEVHDVEHGTCVADQIRNGSICRIGLVAQSDVSELSRVVIGLVAFNLRSLHLVTHSLELKHSVLRNRGENFAELVCRICIFVTNSWKTVVC